MKKHLLFFCFLTHFFLGYSQTCYEIDSHWATPAPTQSTYFFGPNDFTTGIPAVTLQGATNLNPIEFFELYTTPNPGSSKVSAVSATLGNLIDSNDNFTFIIGIYNADVSGNPVGPAINGTAALSPTSLGVLSGANYLDFLINLSTPVAIDSANFLVGLSMYPGDLTDQLLLVSSATGQGQAAGLNFVQTSGLGYLSYLSDVGLDFDLSLIPKIGEPVTSTDTIIACDSLTWIDGITYTSNNNTATYNLVGGAANGCDSIVTLNLTINSVSDITTSLSFPVITANNSSATYQWLNCDSNYSIIPGQTSQSFTVAANGNYAVELTENGCVDTSNCVSVQTTGVINYQSENQLILYPNPSASGNFSIQLNKALNHATIQVLDLNGRVIYAKQHNTTNINLDLNQPTGVYVLQVETDKWKETRKLVIK